MKSKVRHTQNIGVSITSCLHQNIDAKRYMESYGKILEKYYGSYVNRRAQK